MTLKTNDGSYWQTMVETGGWLLKLACPAYDLYTFDQLFSLYLVSLLNSLLFASLFFTSPALSMGGGLGTVTLLN